LNLLPGIGKKLRNNILDARKRGPFESFEDLEERVSGLHRPKEVLVERILEELRDDDLKYKTFVGRTE
jgi:putative nucleotide binding protein